MSVRHYTAAQLHALRASPLVAKPENLPSIEQWIEYVYLEVDGVREKLRIPHSESAQQQQQQSSTSARGAASTAATGDAKENKRRGGAAHGPPEPSPMGSFSTGRPTLGRMGSSVRGSGEDVALGPPKTMFPSSRNVPKLSDLAEPAAGEESESARSRFFSDRQTNRRSGLVDEKEGRDNRDSWTRAAERRAAGEQDDRKAGDRHDRYGRHDNQDGERRNGYGDKHDPRWTNNRDDRRGQNGDRPTGGWREREQARRNGDRGNDEREPEWMEDPVVKKDQDLGFSMARTQEEFQKWKDGMNKKNKGEAEKEEVVEAPVAPPPPVEPKPSLKLDGFEGGFFGATVRSDAASAGASTPPASAAPKSSTVKSGKTSRFASMFKPPPDETPPPAVPESSVTNAANDAAKTSAEDQEGFNRVLQMLGGGLKIGGGQPSPAMEAPTSASPQLARGSNAGQNGAGGKPKSRFTNLFEAKSPDGLQSPQPAGMEVFENRRDEHAQMMNGRPQDKQEQPSRSHAPEQTMSPEPSNMFNALREQQPRPSSSRVNELSMFDPPSRGAASPDINIQNLLAQQQRRPQATSSESQQLLNLLRKGDPAQSRPPVHRSTPSNGGMSQPELQRWLDQQHQAHNGGGPPQDPPHAPQPRMPQQPPGLFEKRIMHNYGGMPDHPDHGGNAGGPPPPQMPPGIPDPRRAAAQRAPPGLYDDQAFFQYQQRQQEQQHAVLRRDGPPQMGALQGQQQQQQQQLPRRGPPPPQQGMHVPGGGPPPPPGAFPPPPQHDYLHHLTSPLLGSAGGPQQQSAGTGPPPPGFNAMMPRHPPGFLQGQQGPQQQMQQVYGGCASGGPPPGFFGSGGPPPGMGGPPPPPPGFMTQQRFDYGMDQGQPQQQQQQQGGRR